MKPRSSISAVMGGVILLVAGCATTVTGQPVPTPISPASSSEGPPPRLAPAVRAPLDARGIKACDLLTASQLAELNLDPATAEPKTVGVTDNCSWAYMNDPGNVGGVQLSTRPRLPALDGIYLLRGTTKTFEPMEIAGHPAVRADAGGADCTIYVGIANYQGVAVGADTAGRPRADACAPSRRMAEMILSNLPPLR